MSATLDHLVLRMRNEPAMLEFYFDLLGFAPDRLDEYRAGEVPFPSVRIDATTVIDLFPTDDAAPASGSLDHFCIALDRASWDHLERRFMERGLAIDGPRQVWGACGRGTSIYVSDPDGNTVEFKTYEEPAGG